MFHQPEHYPNLSQRLSAVLDDIGVNEATVIKRRRAWMLRETLRNIHNQLLGHDHSSFFFGSQTEGSTTLGLNSDVDYLLIQNTLRGIQDWSEWVEGKRHFLMVQDETTSPGYCLLQKMRDDLPLPVVPVRGFQNENFIADIKGRLLVRHASCLHQIPDGSTRHGPAETTNLGSHDTDFASAFHCPTWPKEAVPWLHQQNASGWPTEDMKRFAVEQGCFLVPVGSRTGVYHDQEWRISTSLAERCLMFNINITQMRCYILMKMILKTFVQPKCGDAVSSFMCKNILFQCIAYSGADDLWNECTLLTWLKECLQAMLNCILTENCPHFLIPRNLLAGKLSGEVKHQLVEVMCKLMENTEQSLLGIGIDDLGNRLHVKSSGILGAHLPSAYYIGVKVAFCNIFTVVSWQQATINFSMEKLSHNSTSAYQSLTQNVSQLCQKYSGGPLEQMASSLITPFLCTIIGSTVASVDIQQSGVLSREALDWFCLGLNSDVCTGKLKLASALYCVGELETCEILLLTLRRQMEQTTVQTRCFCYPHIGSHQEDFKKLCYENNENVIRNNMAFCVRHLPCEVNCIPGELKYEMFRTTQEDRPYRNEDDDYWMDWAVVDPLPYLFFLQFKVYGQLHRPADQHRALQNLAWTIDNAPNLGHRETALNLVGQCVEQEDRKEAAFYYYYMSLKVRPTNNAAKWHLGRLLARLLAPD